MDKDIQEASDLAEEFLGKKHHKIQKFMLDIEASIRRLHELCGFKNRRIDQQEAENLLLKEENAAHQLQIRKLRDTMSGKQGSAEESLEQWASREATQEETTMLVLKNLLTKTADWKEDLERYKMKIVVEGILEGMMMGETCQVNMQSQVTNLKLLMQAAIKGQISPELHCMAKYLITCIQDMEGMRLACLLQKFTAFKSMKQVRSEDCKLHLFPPVPRPSNSHPFLIIEPCKLARSPTAAVNRCHRLPPKAQAIPWCPPEQRPNYLP
ncbi:hypothetical protein DPEC_G00238080 [Dallia pectoralis]|uniref:Uncharacterized protein n=1 Tax=Dallia pectoralis TaxID=75939 RepID=A0ACC2FYW0_DALPE|nr:hypothetical protein DPEC_G00238080 [Dallia pectoralis]